MKHMTSVVVIGGGPAGYEAALVARQLGAEVVLIERDGVGGSAVLTDCVPSKTLIATADIITKTRESHALGVLINGSESRDATISVNLTTVNGRVMELAHAQSADIEARLIREGVTVLRGRARLTGPQSVAFTAAHGSGEADRVISADTILIATGARPRTLPDALPDDERILTWEQLYDLPDLPERLIVVGSGVTGAEFASAYHALGSDVVLVSSRDRVLPGEDPDAAAVLEEVFARRGLEVVGQARAVSAVRTASGVEVTLADGRVLAGSHVLMAVGSLPNTDELGLDEAGVDIDSAGFITVDRVSRTSARGSMPPVTAQGSSCSHRSRRCRDASLCGTRSAMPSPRSTARWSRARSSPIPRSPPSGSLRRISTMARSAAMSSSFPSPPMPARRCRRSTTAS
jgi:dihydrolipoamide dehydrogenase